MGSNENTWGGARPGSGRKSVSPEEKKVQMVITVEPDTKDRLKRLAEVRQTTPGRLIDQIIRGMIC